MKILAEPIDVIARFKAKEKPVPVKFRFQDQEIPVDKIIQIDETKLAGIKSIVYHCQSCINNEVKRYELKYILDKWRWELYKM